MHEGASTPSKPKMYIPYPPISAKFINLLLFSFFFVFWLPPYFDHDASMCNTYWTPLLMHS